jgi:hypothetical protein
MARFSAQTGVLYLFDVSPVEAAYRAQPPRKFGVQRQCSPSVTVQAATSGCTVRNSYQARGVLRPRSVGCRNRLSTPAAHEHLPSHTTGTCRVPSIGRTP